MYILCRLSEIHKGMKVEISNMLARGPIIQYWGVKWFVPIFLSHTTEMIFNDSIASSFEPPKRVALDKKFKKCENKASLGFIFYLFSRYLSGIWKLFQSKCSSHLFSYLFTPYTCNFLLKAMHLTEISGGPKKINSNYNTRSLPRHFKMMSQQLRLVQSYYDVANDILHVSKSIFIVSQYLYVHASYQFLLNLYK